MANSYKNAESVTLSDFISADRFRMILPEHRHMEGGISEIPVEIQMKRPFADTLSLNVEWDGIVYGYVRGKKSILEKLKNFPVVTRITLTDWDDKFQLLFEGEKETDELPYFVSADEVRTLIENCKRVPAQMLVKKI